MTAVQPIPAKHLPKALLGLVMERRLLGASEPEEVPVSSPWDLWWACFRAVEPADQLGIHASREGAGCVDCDRDALALATASPPRHPDVGGRPCDCLLAWAIRMRRPVGTVQWPLTRLSLALLKPGAPHDQIRAALEKAHQVLSATETMLTTDDTRWLYPEAYGADYVAARDAYLTSGSVQILLLRRTGPGAASQLKVEIRRIMGADTLRNHLHMPDNPGEAFADIAYLVGAGILATMYERHERDRSAERLAFYRAALGIRCPDAHRGTAENARGQAGRT
jgi:hypothetical protein